MLTALVLSLMVCDLPPTKPVAAPATIGLAAGANLGRIDASASHTKTVGTTHLPTWQMGGQPVSLALCWVMSTPPPFGNGAYLSAQPIVPVGSIRYVPVLDLAAAWELKVDRAIDVALAVGGVATVTAVAYSLLR